MATVPARVSNPLLLTALLVGLGSSQMGQLSAQTFGILHSFTGNDGASPRAGMIQSGNTLFGTTGFGGSSNKGTVFSLRTDGAGFTNLHSFTGDDGTNPWAELVLLSNSIYGTTSKGGHSNEGVVFAVRTDGTGFTVLHDFTPTNGSDSAPTNSDGAVPYGGLVLSGNTLYGTAAFGGSFGWGTLFTVDAASASFVTLHSFTASSGFSRTNTDGVHPRTTLVKSASGLYGTAGGGGTSGYGTVFGMGTDGTGFRTLHSFTADPSLPGTRTNTDGMLPYESLVLSGDSLYGTAVQGGIGGSGTVFKLNTNGSDFTVLYSFSATSGSSPTVNTNRDGASPSVRLIVSGNTLFGAAYIGGEAGSGTVFVLNLDGTGFRVLHSFTALEPVAQTNPDGAYPNGLLLSGNTLYGTTSGGGFSGKGTIFSISLAPPLTIASAGTNVILTWATNFAGFDYTRATLQSTTNIVSPDWITSSPVPVVINGHNAVTNPISGTQQFFRLSQ